MDNSLVEIIKSGNSNTIHSKSRGGSRKYVPKDLDGCVLYLPMDEKVANLSIDHSGLNNHGTIYGAVETNGQINKGLYFDGIDDYVDCGNLLVFNIRKVTVMAWVKVVGHSSDGKWGRIIEKRYSNSYYLGLNENETKFKGCFADVSYPYGTLESTTVINYGTWYHVVITHDEINDCLYVNGILESSTPNNRILNNTTQNVYLGKLTIGNIHIFKGTIDEARIYNRILPPKEIFAIYQQEL